MAHETANQKRKRGRPSNASQDTTSASRTQTTLTNSGTIANPRSQGGPEDADEAARPRKRGRPARTEAEPDAPEAEVEAPVKRKRGRPSLSQKPQYSAEPENAEEAPVPAPKPKKRGRPSHSQEETPADDVEDAGAATTNRLLKKRGRPSTTRVQEDEHERRGDSSQPKKRGRRPRAVGKENEAAENEDAAEADDEQEGDSSLLRRSERDRQSVGAWYKGTQEEDHEQEGSPETEERSRKPRRKKGRPVADPELGAEAAEPDTQPKKKKRGRPSLQNDAAQDTAEKSTEKPKKKRGRPSLEKDGQNGQKPNHRQRQSEDELDQDSAPERAPRRKGRPRTSDTSTHRPSQEHAGSRSPSPDPAPYRHLTTRVRRIPRDTITNKWSPLDATSIDSVTELLHSASRPVLLRLNNLQKHAQATAALNAISNRLRSRLTRGLPFPPATTSQRREDELEFERTVDGIQSLQAQLDPLLHGVSLLQREKERAEKELEREYRLLNALGANARSEARSRRDQLRKVHTLVPEPPSREDAEAKSGIGELQAVDKAVGKTFIGLDEDQDLKGAVEQLGNHIESMRGNLQQVQGVLPAIADSGAALRLALLPHLDQESYERVLLG
ncbi:uncharacterized protein JN550_012346 [Neoarthrinium moseri]|uniref:uncharacterized protein n=1 Tax=Neoarthrinium moseri TaxID=1658444 RepID=UPI001FDD32FA|nr:uncharacterized protein JN550_012346 [Neoarthrinium moseri]KAI1858887.1 hypothetical protein JN550_012346 [Neoarthrinium moseri]